LKEKKNKTIPSTEKVKAKKNYWRTFFLKKKKRRRAKKTMPINWNRWTEQAQEQKSIKFQSKKMNNIKPRTGCEKPEEAQKPRKKNPMNRMCETEQKHEQEGKT
jgi:hypothetical protein